MPSTTLCSLGMMCPAEMDSLTNVGKIVGIVVGSVIGLTFLICILVIIYLIFCKRKSHVQVWAYPCPRPQPYGQTESMFVYSNYPQELRTQPAIDPHRIVEEPPPAYEEIDTIENATKQH